MSKMRLILMCILASMVMVVPMTAGAAAKKAIVVASFGTTFDHARKVNIESVEQDVTKAFPKYDTYRAFTSRIVMKRLADKGIFVDDLDKTLNKLHQQGYSEVIVQPTLITPEEEYDNKIMKVVNKYKAEKTFEKLIVSRPLLTYQGKNGQTDDFAVLSKAISGQFPKKQAADEVVLFMGHGSPNRHNVAYKLLHESMLKDNKQVAMGVVEDTDYPNFQDALSYIKSKGYKKILLMPLMLVAGDHAHNDMAGEEPDSWKNMLLKEGFEVSVYMKGLGENPAVRAIFVEHIKDAIVGK